MIIKKKVWYLKYYYCIGKEKKVILILNFCWMVVKEIFGIIVFLYIICMKLNFFFDGNVMKILKMDYVWSVMSLFFLRVFGIIWINRRYGCCF